MVPESQILQNNAAHALNYNHAIGGLVLSEVYGMTPGRNADALRVAIERALQFTYQRLPSPKRNRRDQGGWRYRYYHVTGDADLSVTSWCLLFLRSAKNAGFDVPTRVTDEAMDFVKHQSMI